MVVAELRQDGAGRACLRRGPRGAVRAGAAREETEQGPGKPLWMMQEKGARG